MAAKLGRVLALRFARALLACAIEDASAWPGPVVIAPACAGDLHWAQQLIEMAAFQYPAQAVSQIEGNLGQRLNHLDQTLRALNNNPLIFIGSDAPGLGVTDYLTVLAELQRADVVLIPARDGGVVLMAGRNPWPDLSTLPWSSNRLGIGLIQACKSIGYTVCIIGDSYDVDEVSDVRGLAVTLRHDLRPARQALYALVVANLAVIRTADA
ncbi:MAG: DUF2064 domain-containing protein [Nitrosomonas sp.]|nr:MAG: DUF2064 domain-containing protein [Nitrosomonas sp.]